MNGRNTLDVRPRRKLVTVLGGTSERGGALITVALSLVVLMGMAALAIDGGSAYNERRTTQNAADNTALAAAWAHCMDVADPVDHAMEVAADNGYDSTQEDVEVDVELDTGGEFESQYRARVTSINDTTFARIIGTDEVTVLSEATAACVRSEGGGAFAMFTKGPDCQLRKDGNTTVTGDVYSAGDMVWDGSGAQIFDGSMHSDGDIDVQGTSLNITGSATASGTSNDPVVQTGVPPKDLDYPVNFHINDFLPEGEIATITGDQYYEYSGDVRASDINANGQGIHFVDGNIVHHGPSLSASPVTIVATGTITLNSPQFTAYHKGLAMMAGATGYDSESCNTVIDLGGTSNIAGLLLAPNGQLDVHGGAVNGGMIAWSIVTGGSLSLDVDVSLFPGGLPQVFLLS